MRVCGCFPANCRLRAQQSFEPARGKSVPSPLLGVASHRPHRHAAWQNAASFRIGNLHAKARVKSNVALSEKNSVQEQK